jgi:Tol biopolymer transport system component
MALAPGARLGPYEIAERVGVGGMGEVYRATDTRLDRIVAVKVLPGEVSDDEARRQRFEREARTIASLNHPHICALYDIGVADGVLFLVMEYLEGETLAQRLRRGPLPVADALRYGTEIAEALDHAHRDGITHRDLKPANVMLTRSGAKLLDFGLAKAFARAEAPASPAETESLTEEGSILGTVHYMSPEQLEAGEIDSRTDIFAFGAVLYEMVSGRRPFVGGSRASVIAAILEREPTPTGARTQPDDASGNGAAPSLLDHVITRCLAKSPDERWQTAGDLMRELRWIAGGGTPLRLPARTRVPGSRRVRLAIGAFGVAAGVVALVLALAQWRPASSQATPPLQFEVPPPEGAAFNPAAAFMALSPDGRHLAFSAANRNAGMALWLRSLDSVAVRQLTTEEGAQPFWSADSRFIAFFSGGQYKTIDITNGRVQLLIDAQGLSGTWNSDDVIVMKLRDRPFLSRFPAAAGGPPTPATTLDAARGETAHAWPHFLPDNRHFLYVALSSQPEHDKTIYVGSLDSPTDRKPLLTADTHAVYSPPGYLLFVRGSSLFAQPFDADGLRLTGDPVPIAEGIDRGPGARGAFSVSRDGKLAYRGVGDTRLMWIDRSGGVPQTIGPRGYYANPALSPDGQRAAVARLDRAIGSFDIWLLDIARGVPSRFTFDASSEDMPLWSLDGSRIVFRSIGRLGRGFFEKASTGTGPEHRLLDVVSQFASPLGWSRRGQALLYAASNGKTLSDLWELPRSGNRAPVALLNSSFWEIQGQPSPDGRWLAYVSNESGNYEVYVRATNGEGKWPISSGGGLEPRWRSDSKELFYLAADRSLMSVVVHSTASTFAVGPPVRLLETRLSTVPNSSYTRNQYDVTPDGQRFLINQPSSETSATITVVVNWPAAPKK